MGIIIKEKIKMDNGLELSDCYERFANIRSIREGEFIICSELYASKEARYNGFKPLAYNESTLTIDKTIFSKKFCDLVYGCIKNKYTKSQDVLTDPVTELPTIEKSKVEGEDIVIEFTIADPVKELTLLSSRSTEFKYTVETKENKTTITIKDYKLMGQDLSKMNLWIKSDNKFKTGPIEIEIEGWSHPLENKEAK